MAKSSFGEKGFVVAYTLMVGHHRGLSRQEHEQLSHGHEQREVNSSLLIYGTGHPLLQFSHRLRLGMSYVERT